MAEKFLWAGLLRAPTANRQSEYVVADFKSVSGMSLLGFCEWLATTPGSIALHESRYLYLIVLSVHVLTLCMFVGTAAMIDLRLLGLTMASVRVSEVVTRLLPWTAAGFLVMITSGALLFYAAPLIRYQNIFFRAKMVTLVLAGVNVWVFHKTVYRRVAEWDLYPVPPRGARMGAGLALVLWATLIMLGRMIPYQVYWFDCNKQPQPAIVNLLAGCITDSR
jgi:hypothetical protein